MEGDLASTFLYLFEVTLSPVDKAGCCLWRLAEGEEQRDGLHLDVGLDQILGDSVCRFF